MIKPCALALLLLALGAVTPAAAGAWLRDDVTYAGGRYTMAMAMRVDAPYAAVHAALTDYNNLTRLSPAMTESTVLTRTPLVIRTVMRDCFLFYCTSLTNTQAITEPSSGHIIATSDASRSSLRYGTTEWRITPAGTATLVTMQAVMEPSLWVPPLIGPAIIKARMKEQAETALVRLETVAQGNN